MTTEADQVVVEATCVAGVWSERDGAFWPERCGRLIETSAPCRECGRGAGFDLHAPLLYGMHRYNPRQWRHIDGERHGHDARRD